jgi:coproporphyrinogen III oxidase
MSDSNIKKQFDDIYKNIKRDGATELYDYLTKSDFFRAPASTKFHSNFAGGLCEHSVKVYMRFRAMCDNEYGKEWIKKNEEMIAIIALLHDICKVNCYKVEERNVKVGSEWVKKPYYAYEDQMPYGHGEKSVYIIGGFMRLTREEAMAINWHMGGFDTRNLDGKYTISGAFQLYPIAVLFHAADLLTSYIDEKIVK